MSDYIMSLREYVGHAPLLQCAASVIIENDRGEVLLGRRTDNHQWGYSGGSIELTESVEDCARRELLEEMGLAAEELEFLCVNSGPEAHYVYPNGDEVYNVEIVYVCRRWHGQPRPQPEEMEELRFFPKDALPPEEEISPPIRGVMRKYLRERG